MQAASARFVPAGWTPTPQQRAIQVARGRDILVDANAGSGKTRTLALCIAEDLERQLADGGRFEPERILALTYTDAGRLALRRAVDALGFAAAVTARLRIATFDEFATALLREVEGEVPLLQRPEQLRSRIEAACEALRERAGARPDPGLQLPEVMDAGFCEYFLRASLRIKGRLVLARARWQDLPLTRALASDEGEDYLILRLLQRFEAIRTAGDDGPRFRSAGDATCDLADAAGECDSDALGQRFPGWPQDLAALYVDEMHDVNEAMFTILRCLLRSNARARFCGVGDRDQVLHQKAGAEPKFLEAAHFARETGRQADAMTLAQTFRFSQAVGNLAQAIAAKPYRSAALHPTALEVRCYADPQDCARQVVEAALRWHERGERMEQFVVLLRDPHQSVAIENALLMMEIPYRVSPFGSYLHRTEVLLVRALYAIGNREAAISNPRTLYRMIQAIAGFCGVSIPHQASSAESLKERTVFAVESIRSDPARMRDFFENVLIRKAQPYLSRRLVAALDVAASVQDQTTLERLIAALEMEAIAPQRWVERQRQQDALAHLQGLLDAAGGFAGAADFFEQLNRMDQLYERTRSERWGTLLLSDIPSVKGLEFGQVLIPWIEAGRFPSAAAFSDEDEANLFYVGVTRCKKALTLLVSASRPGPFGALAGVSARRD